MTFLKPVRETYNIQHIFLANNHIPVPREAISEFSDYTLFALREFAIIVT